MPLLMAKRALNTLNAGEILRLLATDPGSRRDFEIFARQSGNVLLQADEADGEFSFVLRKN
jgi:tRNA 2-thiouridine synthesizing protein A